MATIPFRPSRPPGREWPTIIVRSRDWGIIEVLRSRQRPQLRMVSGVTLPEGGQSLCEYALRCQLANEGRGWLGLFHVGRWNVAVILSGSEMDPLRCHISDVTLEV